MESIFLEGNQRAIILYHAYTGTTSDVRFLGQALHKLGYTVYLPLYTGHGTKNIFDILNSNPQTWYNDTKEAVAFLKAKGYQQIAIFGLSMGGVMSMRYLQEQDPTIIGGGAFNAALPLDENNHLQPAFLAYAEMLYKKVEQTLTLDNYLIEVEKAFLKQIEELKNTTILVADNLHKIDNVVYIAQSGADELINPNMAEQMLNKLIFATVDFNWFEKATHVITVGQYRQEFQQSVIQFVENLDWSK